MKNLSKVLAVVLAFMLVFTAVGAANYTDVAADAKYNEAVSVLSSLKILTGYEDGSFKPEGNITRAEFAAVVCRLLGLEETANGAKGQQVFDDVPGDHWASGYVALASQQGIVNGYGDGKFGPEDNVLYEQAIKMIVAALGYTPMADVNGGYPGGYQIVAAQRGILAGVTGGATGVAATRAIVAQMSYNALEVPIMGQTSFGTDIKFTATNELLLNKLGVTKFEGNIEQTPVSDKSIKAGKVKVNFQRQITAINGDYTAKRYTMDQADDWANPADVIGTISGTNRTATIKVADEIVDAAEKNLDYYAVMYVADATDSDAELIAIFPKETKNADVEFKAKDVSEGDSTRGPSNNAANLELTDNGSAVTGTVAVYTDKDADRTEEYDLLITKVYVNGREQDINATALNTVAARKAALNKYLQDTSSASVKFMSNTDADEYNIAYITYYTDIVVDSINAKAATVTAKTPMDGVSRVKFDEEYEGKYTILKDGAEVAFEDIKEDDVLSIAGYVNASTKELEYGTVIITSEKATGKVSTYDTDDRTVTVGGKEYDYNTTIGGMLSLGGATGINLGDEVVLYINAAGYVIDADKTASKTNLKYGFATKVVMTTGVEDSWQIRILTTDGTWSTFNFASKVSFEGATAINVDASTNMASKLAANAINGSAYVNDIIGYETNSSNEINKVYVNEVMGNIDATFNAVGANAQYIASTDGIGGAYLDDNTVIFSVDSTKNPATDVLKDDDVTVAKKDALVDRTTYNITGYGANDEGFVKVVYGSGIVGEIDMAADFFVISGIQNTTNEDGDEGYLLEGYVAGEVATVFADKTETSVEKASYNGSTISYAPATVAGLAKGDVILYSKAANGEAANIRVLMANADVKAKTDALGANFAVASNVKLADITVANETYTFYFGFAFDRVGGRLELAANTNGTGSVTLSGQSAIGASVDNYASKLKVLDATVGEIDVDKTNTGLGDVVFVRTKYGTNVEDFVIYDYND